MGRRTDAAKRKRAAASTRAAVGFVITWIAWVAADAASGELLVGAAASLREPMLTIGERFREVNPEVSVAISFAASSVLANQIRAGAPIDVFASADEQLVIQLGEEGLVVSEEAVPIASNRLVVIVTADTAFAVDGANDLMRPELRRIAIPDLVVPVGRYARQWLAQHGLDRRLRGRMLQTEHALATLRAVDAGHADAAIVYASDARLARSARLAFEIPEREQPRIIYAAAPVVRSRERAAATRFVRFLASATAREILIGAGFAGTDADRLPDGGSAR